MKTSSSKNGAGRPPVKQLEITQDIIHNIRKGTFKPGQLLPSWEELANHYHTTRTTIRRSLELLVQEKIIKTIARQGTFITRTPPCLRNIAVVFPHSPDEENWRGIDEAILTTIKQKNHQHNGFRFTPYFALHSNTLYGRDRVTNLCDDIERGKIGAVFFTSNMWPYEGTTLLTHPDIPRVTMQPFPLQASASTINFTGSQFIPMAIDRLKCMGATRLAILCNNRRLDSVTAESLNQCQLKSLQCERALIQGSPIGTPELTRRVVELLFKGGKQDYPDGFIVTDDSYLPHVLHIFNELNIVAHQDVKLISHANFTGNVIPIPGVVQLGYDMHDVVNLATISILEQRTSDAFRVEWKCEPTFQPAVD